MGTHDSIIAVFRDRDVLEKAIGQLVAAGVDRSQVSLLASSRSVEEIRRARDVEVRETTEPVDRADTGNVQGIVAGIPAYVAAVLAAGVSVASGGTLAGVALAALGGGAAGGLLGAGAAKLFGDSIDATYEDQLARGGIMVLVSPLDEAQAQKAEATLRANGGEHVGRHHADMREP